MTVEIQRTGPIRLEINSGDGFAPLGLTAGPVKLTDEAIWQPVATDRRGGRDEAAVDQLWLGSRLRMALELDRWDAAVARQLAARHPRQTPGRSDAAWIGRPLRQDGAFAARLTSRTLAREYPCVLCLRAIHVDYGPQASRLALELEAHADVDGQIWRDVDM